jgi:hypothetical protein
MTVLSCVAIGIAFLLAVGLLVFAGVLLGWYLPALIDRARRRRGEGPPEDPHAGGPLAPPPGI